MEEFPGSGHLADHDICTGCIAKHLKVKIVDDGLTSVLCPDGVCKSPLEYHEIERHADPNVFAR